MLWNKRLIGLIPKIFFTYVQQQPLPGVRTMGLEQNVSLEMYLVHRLLIFSDNIGVKLWGKQIKAKCKMNDLSM